jgi:hypothetical protein
MPPGVMPGGFSILGCERKVAFAAKRQEISLLPAASFVTALWPGLILRVEKIRLTVFADVLFFDWVDYPERAGW